MSAIVPADTITQYWSPNLIARLRGLWGGYGSALWVACGLAAVGALAIALLPAESTAPVTSAGDTPLREPTLS